MKHLFLLFLFISVSITNTFSQSINDTIATNYSNGTTYSQHGKEINRRQLLEITKSDFNAFAEMKKANNNLGTAYILAYTGGYLIGWQLGRAAFGNKFKWGYAGVGAGLALISIPFFNSSNKYAENAVQIYNRGLKQTAQNKITLNLALTGDGIRIRLRL